MPRKRNPESGRFEEVFPDEIFIELLEDNRLGTSEVAEKIGSHRTTAHAKLTQLESEGKVKSKKVGNVLMWELTAE